MNNLHNMFVKTDIELVIGHTNHMRNSTNKVCHDMPYISKLDKNELRK